MTPLAVPIPEQDPKTKGVKPADLNSDLATLYSDAYFKTWNAFQDYYQRLYNEYLNYYSNYHRNFKGKRADVSINESIVSPGVISELAYPSQDVVLGSTPSYQGSAVTSPAVLAD